MTYSVNMNMSNTFSGLLFLSLTLGAQGAFIWAPSTGSFVGGTADGEVYDSVANTDTATGYTDLALNQTDPHTFRDILGVDLGLTLSVAFTNGGGMPALARNFRTSGGDSVILFDLDSELPAFQSFNVTFTYSSPIGTWETGNQNTNPITGSNAEFASRFQVQNLNPATFDDLSISFATTASPVSPPGQPPAGAWDFLSDFALQAGNATNRVVSGAFNENLVYTFDGVTANPNPNSTDYRATLRDGEGTSVGTGGDTVTNFTDSYTWTLTAGDTAIPAGTSFNITLDGTPFTIPEPSSTGLLLLGFASVCFMRRRRA